MKISTRYLLAALAGTLYFLGQVGFNQWYLAWVCLVPLFFALENVRPKQGFFLGWLFGTVAVLGCFYWLTYTIHVFAYMPWPVAALGCILLCAAQGLQFALFALLYTWLRTITGTVPVIIGPLVYTFAEFVSPQLFPHYFVNSQYMNIPILQVSDITGVLGVGVVLTFVNASIFVIIKTFLEQKKFHWKTALSALLLVGITLTYGYLRLPVVRAQMERSPKIRFGITQANLGIREKIKSPKKSIGLNQEQTKILKEMGAEIVLWPETAVQRPVLIPGQKKISPAIFHGLDIPLLFGTFELDAKEKRIYNVAALTDQNGNILGVYKKQKLLMLGEYIPLGEIFPKLYEWFPYIGRMTPGTLDEPLKFKDYLFGINICYEGILPRFINRIVRNSPNVLVNLTNDNWFGPTHEPLQHLVLAAQRSVENRLWTVRSTNTGISAFVDATGEIVEKSPLMEEDILIHNVSMMTGKTFYARTGDWLGWLSIILITIFSLFCIEKKRKHR